MAQPDLLGILDAEHQNLGVYYGLGEKSPSLCTKSRFPSPTFLAVSLAIEIMLSGSIGLNWYSVLL